MSNENPNSVPDTTPATPAAEIVGEQGEPATSVTKLPPENEEEPRMEVTSPFGNTDLQAVVEERQADTGPDGDETEQADSVPQYSDVDSDELRREVHREANHRPDEKTEPNPEPMAEPKPEQQEPESKPENSTEVETGPVTTDAEPAPPSADDFADKRDEAQSAFAAELEAAQSPVETKPVEDQTAQDAVERDIEIPEETDGNPTGELTEEGNPVDVTDGEAPSESMRDIPEMTGTGGGVGGVTMPEIETKPNPIGLDPEKIKEFEEAGAAEDEDDETLQVDTREMSFMIQRYMGRAETLMHQVIALQCRVDFYGQLLTNAGEKVDEIAVNDQIDRRALAKYVQKNEFLTHKNMVLKSRVDFLSNFIRSQSEVVDKLAALARTHGGNPDAVLNEYFVRPEAEASSKSDQTDEVRDGGTYEQKST